MRKRALYRSRTSAVYEAKAFPAKNKVDAAGLTLPTLLICTAAAAGSGGPPATLGRLEEVIAPLGFYSPRQMNDIVARPVHTGCVESVPDPLDRRRRRRRLRPTERLLAWDRDWLAAYDEPLRLVFPKPGFARALPCAPALHAALRRAGLRQLPVASAPMKDRDLRPLLGRTCAIAILPSLTPGRFDGRVRDVDGMAVAHLVSRFGVSRSHVRNVLAEARTSGFLELAPGHASHLRSTERRHAAVDRFIADTLTSSEAT